MKVVKADAIIMDPIDGQEILKKIETCGRVCYKSEDKMTDESSARFIASIIRRGHESVLEHYSISVRFICDRGISHEIVRHRIASFSQESTRYCNYSNDKFGKEINVIDPEFGDNEEAYKIWYKACEDAEKAYFDLLDAGCTPQYARAVLPTCLKTELVMTCNIREWRHFLKLRCEIDSHPQVRKIASILLEKFKTNIPVLFDDI